MALVLEDFKSEKEIRIILSNEFPLDWYEKPLFNVGSTPSDLICGILLHTHRYDGTQIDHPWDWMMRMKITTPPDKKHKMRDAWKEYSKEVVEHDVIEFYGKDKHLSLIKVL